MPNRYFYKEVVVFFILVFICNKEYLRLLSVISMFRSHIPMFDSFTKLNSSTSKDLFSFSFWIFIIKTLIIDLCRHFKNLILFFLCFFVLFFVLFDILIGHLYVVKKNFIINILSSFVYVCVCWSLFSHITHPFFFLSLSSNILL